MKLSKTSQRYLQTISTFILLSMGYSGHALANQKEINPIIAERLTKFDQNITRIEVPDHLKNRTACLPIANIAAKKLSAANVAYDLYLPVRDAQKCQTKGLIILANFAKNNPNQRNDSTSAGTSGKSFTLLQNIAKGLRDKGYMTAIIYHHANQGDKETLINNINTVRNQLKSDYPYVQKNNTFYVGSSFSGFAVGDNAFWDGRITNNFNGLVMIQSGMYRQGLGQLKIPLISYVCKNDTTATSSVHVGGVEMYNQLPSSIKSKSKGFNDNTCSGHNVNSSWTNPVVADVVRLFQ